MKPQVAGLRGLAGAGKTTISLHLSVHGFDEVSLVGPMREGFSVMGITKRGTPELYRMYLQEVGVSMRERNPDHWVNLAKDRINAHLAAGHSVVIDDVRFPNEADLCDVLFYVAPQGFQAADLGERASHVSEAWNRAYGLKDPLGEASIPTILLPNPVGRPEKAAQAIIDHLRQKNK